MNLSYTKCDIKPWNGPDKEKEEEMLNKLKAIKKQWVDAYHNLDEISGLSVKAEVGPTDEWCAEAYMETDYTTLKDRDFEKKMNDYIAFKFLTGLK